MKNAFRPRIRNECSVQFPAVNTHICRSYLQFPQAKNEWEPEAYICLGKYYYYSYFYYYRCYYYCCYYYCYY